ncbi:MAG TPA: hypothetical protein VK939_00345 [Longimicrobiales bacterium]|nr:hypothetical protein [Longimicrobiales bacterium]
MTMQSRRSGFALPMAILLIGIMTVGLVAAFTRIEAESRIVDHLATEVAAFALAQTGLDRVLATGDTLPADQTLTLSGGTAQVRITRVRRNATYRDTSVWLIRSTGRTTARGVGRPSAVRTVAQLAVRVPAPINVLSSWTSLSGLDKNGVAGSLAGADACGVETTLAGVAVPTGTFTGQDNAMSGNPPIDATMDQQQLATATRIDWNGIVDPVSPAIRPDIVLCMPGTYGYDPNWGPCGTWPTSFPTDYWPVILINGTSPLPSNGRGALLVTGNLTFGGNNKWDGIVFVGGKIVDNGSGVIGGAVVSGLNVTRPSPWPSTVEASSIANGTKNYAYDSCKVARAAASLQKMEHIPNAWLDNWSGAGWTH